MAAALKELQASARQHGAGRAPAAGPAAEQPPLGSARLPKEAFLKRLRLGPGVRLMLVRFSRKSNKPFNAGASTLYFLYCYIFTGMLFCVFWGASFLFADALTTGANACGPYKSAAAAAFDTLKTEASADADVFKVLEDEGVEKFEVSWNELLDATAEQLTAAKG